MIAFFHSDLWAAIWQICLPLALIFGAVFGRDVVRYFYDSD